MDYEMVIRGSLARLPGNIVSEAAVLREFEAHGLTSEDSRMVLDKAILEAFVERAGDGTLVKQVRASEDGSGHAP